MKILVISLFMLSVHFAYAQTLKEQALEIKLYETQEWKSLLHYHGKQSKIDKNSTFFLSEYGYKNPKAELLETIALLENQDINNNHVSCRYPARAEYILESLSNDEIEINTEKCTAFEEYIKKVSTEQVYIVFASEDIMNPSSMMGHMFLKLSGRIDNIEREHSLSYLASISSNPTDYLHALTGKIDGFYVLEPYINTVVNYIKNENRNLWEFEIKLSEKEKNKLLKHIWELKEKNIKYNFITNNCSDGAIQIIQAISPKIVSSNKMFYTPIDYIQQLEKSNRLNSTNIIATNSYLKKIEKYGIKEIIRTPKPSKIHIYHLQGDHTYTGISFMPVYLDISEPTKEVYFDHFETRIFYFDLRYNSDTDNIFINRLDLLRLKAIIDSSTEFTLSKELKISLENDLEDTNTSISPTLEYGLGYAYSFFEDFISYTMPKIGYRYSEISNLYFMFELGVIYQPTINVNLSSTLSYYIDLEQENRGYNAKLENFATWSLSENYNYTMSYTYYRSRKSEDRNEFSVGLVYKF